MPSEVIRRFLLGWFPFWIYSFIVIQGAVASTEDIPLFLIEIHDKLAHGIQFFLLFFFAINAFDQAKTQWLQRRAFQIALAYCLGMGALTEVLQMFTPERFADMYDFGADALGAGLASLLFYVTRRS